MKRRDFIKHSAIATTGLMLSASSVFSKIAKFESKRPAPAARKFVSKAVEAKIAEVKTAIKDKELAWMFENCYPNTLDTTVETGTRNGEVIFACMYQTDKTRAAIPHTPSTPDAKRVSVGSAFQRSCTRSTGPKAMG